MHPVNPEQCYLALLAYIRGRIRMFHAAEVDSDLQTMQGAALDLAKLNTYYESMLQSFRGLDTLRLREAALDPVDAVKALEEFHRWQVAWQLARLFDTL